MPGPWHFVGFATLFAADLRLMIFDFGIELVWRVSTISSADQNSKIQNQNSSISSEKNQRGS
jgi:hypothetical protein